jgi:hypothetical protein
MAPAEKLALVSAMSRTGNGPSLTGIRARHPAAGGEDLPLRFAAPRLPCKLMMDVFVATTRELDQEELERRHRLVVSADPPGTPRVASPEGVILQELSWLRQREGVPDRLERVVRGVVHLQGRPARSGRPREPGPGGPAADAERGVPHPPLDAARHPGYLLSRLIRN